MHFVIESRGEKSGRKLWNKIPAPYKHCHTYSDFWSAYEKVFDAKTHRSVGKETGETAHIERWNNTLHQRILGYVRKTLSCSKKVVWHHMVTKLFIYNYNISIAVKI
ncbi:MAG: hypothetical protein KAH22_09785 [Thiotrichaceae bacterium]|nr:hypothetical protein [Thiotrichaceae bacterium]